MSSPVIELIAGLAFLFFLASILASAVQEIVASVLGLRARMLVRGVRRLVGDPEVAKAIFAHPVVAAQSKSDKARPSYLDAKVFRRALLDVLDIEPTSLPDALTAQKVPAVDLTSASRLPRPGTVDGRLIDVLASLVRDAGSASISLENAIERWFDDGMDRVSGWYKRQAKWILIAIGLVVAVALNVSTIQVARALWSDPAARALANAQAAAAVQPGDTVPANPLMNLDQSLESVHALALPIGWSDGSRPAPNELPLALAGWIVTACAVSFGAPFWFDVLSRITNLRAAGKVPPRTDEVPASTAPAVVAGVGVATPGRPVLVQATGHQSPSNQHPSYQPTTQGATS